MQVNDLPARLPDDFSMEFDEHTLALIGDRSRFVERMRQLLGALIERGYTIYESHDWSSSKRVIRAKLTIV